MREAVKKIVLRLFPEIAGGYHLDRYARVLKIADPPIAGTKSDRFRPCWAVDIEIITPEGEPAKEFPIYETVPLPVPAGGQDSGFFLWPRPGTIVTVRWIEGRPDHPVIQHVYPMELSMPDVPDNMGKWQQRPGVFQLVDPQGNWERKTDTNITDACNNLSEIVQALKSLEAKDLKEKVSNDKTETIGNSSTETITSAKTITSAAFTVKSPAIKIGAPGGGVSLLPTICNAFGAIQSALNTLASHTHPKTGGCSQGGAVSSQASQVGTAKADIESIQG